MTNEELFTVLRKIVMDVTGVPECILADQNKQAPKGAYASIKPRQSISERGQANIYTANVAGDKVRGDVRAQIMCTCSINFYRGNALELAERLKQCNKRYDVSIDLYKAKLGWNGTSNVNNLTALQANNQEQRAQIDIRLMYEASNISEVNNILSASIAIENEKAEVLQTVDIQ
ncbi:MAG: hypothetical protein CTY32_08560 [Methylotenera sp.]|nr:MAG: hypothetical protein CTY32_08560 [Methylotenera sp.]